MSAAVAGCPGSCSGAVRPERELHLVEATARKAEFLRATAALIGVEAVVHAERSEDLARAGAALRDACACACARALAAPPAAAELCLPFVEPGGRVILWLGRQSADADDVSAGCGCARRSLRAAPTPGLFRAREGRARPRVASRGARGVAWHAGRCAKRIGQAPLRSLRWRTCPASTRSQTRRAGSARRPPRSTSPRASQKRARGCCSSTSIRRRTRRAGSASARERPRARPTTCCTARRWPT